MSRLEKHEIISRYSYFWALFFVSNFLDPISFLVTNLAENNLCPAQTFAMQQNTNFYIVSDLTYQNGVRHYQHQPWNVEDTDLSVKKLSNFFLICWQLAPAYYVVFILFLLFTVCIHISCNYDIQIILKQNPGGISATKGW